MTYQLVPTAELTIEEIIDLIERDLPGWDYLMRSNNRGDRFSNEAYFANIMTPDFTGHILMVPGGYIDVSPGHRFTAYADTQKAALVKAYHDAMSHFHENEPA